MSASVKIISHTLNDEQGPFVNLTVSPTTIVLMVQRANSFDQASNPNGNLNFNNQNNSAVNDSTIGSYVYAIAPKREPKNVLISKLFENPATIDVTERLAKLLVLKLSKAGENNTEIKPCQRGVYVGVSDEGIDNIDITDIVRWVAEQVQLM
ncbi:hypothetical protein NADFUDRAFT_43283 [Nadsonia fulvescens var. elongata DSM 6958]|uniref:Proteasome assembly chaperone 3 n=1 Tax=Nadsonia fulvescens var. elongata DSM 6958 TaxID=857566 RepID=A0A1E3PFV4_9ASCO|nr:hypothetical protein NADFUDRAFT_43283 [Nadsonia fulvescens var. elongata DSM 6958]